MGVLLLRVRCRSFFFFKTLSCQRPALWLLHQFRPFGDPAASGVRQLAEIPRKAIEEKRRKADGPRSDSDLVAVRMVGRECNITHSKKEGRKGMHAEWKKVRDVWGRLVEWDVKDSFKC